jgi:hypothetical protein
MVAVNPPSDVLRTVLLSDSQIDMIRSALGEYLSTFSHHEGDIVHEIKLLLRSLPTLETPLASDGVR